VDSEKDSVAKESTADAAASGAEAPKEVRPGLSVLTDMLKEIRTGVPEAEASVTVDDAKESTDSGVSESQAAAGDESSAELTIETVDPRQVEVARLRGWADDRILKYAKDDPDILTDLVALAEDVESDDSGTENPVVSESRNVSPADKAALSDQDIEALKGEIGEKGAALLKQMRAELSSVKTELAKTHQTDQQKAADVQMTDDIRRFETASKMFDDAAAKHPELGVLKQLPRKKDQTLDTRNPAVQLRGKLWGLAESLFSSGVVDTFQSAVEEALQYHQSKKTKGEITTEIVKDLTDRKKRFLARPTHRNVAEISDKDRDGRGMVTADGKASLIQKAKEQAGLPT
jgi:hypothetical protein